jgi:hypothetical protein
MKPQIVAMLGGMLSGAISLSTIAHLGVNWRKRG